MALLWKPEEAGVHDQGGKHYHERKDIEGCTSAGKKVAFIVALFF